MVFYEKQLDDISLEDIQSVIDNQFTEDKYFEYKQEMKGNEEKANILRVVCGFSNAEGGLFIYGLNEKDKKPHSIQGVSLNNKSWDEKKRSILDSIYMNIEPKVYVDIKGIELPGTDNIVILIKVPKSFNSPHSVRDGQNRKFFIRRDGSTNPMDYEEIKSMFAMNSNLFENINRYKNNRINKMISNNNKYFQIIFHAIPFNIFSNEYISLKKARDLMSNNEFFRGSYNYNFEGLYNVFYPSQIFRNGTFEWRYEDSEGAKIFDLSYFQYEYVDFVKESLTIYNELNINCPIVFFVTLINIQNIDIQKSLMDRSKVIDTNRNILDPNGCIIKNTKHIKNEVHNLFVPIWNHFGKNVDYIFNEDIGN